MLEMTDSHKEHVDSNKKLLDSVKELKGRVAALEADVPKSKATYAHSLAIRNWFFRSFLRDHHPAKYTPGKHKKKVAGDRSAHHGALLLDSYLYTDAIRSDVSTFMLLFGLRPDQISLLRTTCL